MQRLERHNTTVKLGHKVLVSIYEQNSVTVIKICELLVIEKYVADSLSIQAIN